MKSIFSIFVAVLFGGSVLAQTDECAGATALPAVTGTCTTSAWTVPQAFTNSAIAYPACAGGSFRDGWMSFVATSTSTTINVANTNRTMAFAVYSSCSAASLVGCADLVALQGTETLTITTTVGSTYYVRIIRTNNNGTNDMNGTICVYNTPTPPANNECTGAIALTVNPTTTCTATTAGTVLNATASAQANGCGGTADDDVWYSFVATSTVHTITLSGIAGSTTDMYHSVYAGTCGTPGAALVCSDPNTSTVSGLTVGNTYFVRVYTWTSTAGQTSTFNICVSTPVVPPNDECTGAVALTVNPTTTCATQTAGTINGATPSAQANGCGGTADDDVWYSFVATATSHTISLNNITGSTSDMYISVYGGSCGTPGAALVCSDPESTSLSGLTIGNTYFVRVYSWTSTTGQTSSFNICVGTPVVPTNNECTGATALTVNPDLLCGTQTAGTVAGANASAQANSCFGTADDDVWYSFVATSTTHALSLNNVAGSTTDMYHSVYSGTCASIGVPIICNDGDASSLTGLTIGATYYVRVYTYTSTANQTSTFNVCVGTPVVPSNDDCTNATSLTVNSGSCTVTTPGTVGGATTSSQANGCFGTADDDVWYSFVATGTTHNVELVNVSGSTTDLYHAVYSGTCGAPGTELVCSDPNSSTLTGLTIGATYFVRVYSYTSTTGQTTTFNICISSPSPPPNNVTCPQMEPICSGSPIAFTAASNGGTAEVGNNYDCLSTQPNPSWYYLEIAAGGNLVIDITAGSDVDYAIWGPYANLASAQAACGTYPLPLDCSYSTSAIEQAVVNGVTATQVYVLLVTNYANVVQTIFVNEAVANSASTDCSIVPLPVGLNVFNAFLQNEEVQIFWKTATETNSDYFEIQKSRDGKIWQTIKVVQAAGYSTSTLDYSHIDKKPFNGTSYYRLKQVDKDGAFTYSSVRAVSDQPADVVKVYPLPAKNTFTVEAGKMNVTSIKVTDATGRQWELPFEKEDFFYTVDSKELPTGFYTVMLTDGIQTYNAKLVIEK